MITSSTCTMKKPITSLLRLETTFHTFLRGTLNASHCSSFTIHDIEGLDAFVSGGTPSLCSISQA
eukprot:1872852-Prorocentrum_lima.AAC.1